MYKLVILIEPLDNWQAFEAQWPEFLHLVEAMPGLRRESTGRIERFLYGDRSYVQVHELFFDSLLDAERGLASSQGQKAGRLLQRMTAGRMALFLVDQKEDELENIRKYRRDDS